MSAKNINLHPRALPTPHPLACQFVKDKYLDSCCLYQMVDFFVSFENFASCDQRSIIYFYGADQHFSNIEFCLLTCRARTGVCGTLEIPSQPTRYSADTVAGMLERFRILRERGEWKIVKYLYNVSYNASFRIQGFFCTLHYSLKPYTFFGYLLWPYTMHLLAIYLLLLFTIAIYTYFS